MTQQLVVRHSGAVLTTGILDISNEEHHALKAFSHSDMKHLAVSPLRLWYHKFNPAPKPEGEEQSSALKMGSALHCAVLESPETFDSRYVCDLDVSAYPVCLDTMQQLRDWHLATTGKKATGTVKREVITQCLAIPGCPPILDVEKERFEKENDGKTILHPDEWERLAGMARALIEEPALKPILAGGVAERTIVAEDPETGVLLKARLDWMAPKWTLDLKSFTVKRGGSIDKTIHDAIFYEGYHEQIVFYDFVRRLHTNERPGDFESVIGFVESDQPHEVRLKRLTAKRGGSVNLFWEVARQQCRAAIRQYAECLNKYGDRPWRDDRPLEILVDEDIRQLSY